MNYMRLYGKKRLTKKLLRSIHGGGVPIPSFESTTANALFLAIITVRPSLHLHLEFVVAGSITVVLNYISHACVQYAYVFRQMSTVTLASVPLLDAAEIQSPAEFRRRFTPSPCLLGARSCCRRQPSDVVLHAHSANKLLHGGCLTLTGV